MKPTCTLHTIGKLLAIAMLSGLMPAFISLALAADEGQRHTLTHDGMERGYIVHVPPGLTHGKDKVPLVLVLHGGGGNPENAERMTGFSAKADKEGFIVVYPEGTGRLHDRLLTWNARHCCGYAMKNRVDDVGFISALIDKLAGEYPIDARRIYATGMSNGGMMTQRLGIELSSRFAAIAPVVATLFGDESRPGDPVSALMINGMADTHVPFQGGPPGGHFADSWDGTPTEPALEQADFWALADGCERMSDQHDKGAYILTQYRCPAGRNVESYLIKDGGHAWPGGQKGSFMGDEPSTALNATDLIWSFFKAHTK